MFMSCTVQCLYMYIHLQQLQCTKNKHDHLNTKNESLLVAKDVKKNNNNVITSF